MYDGTNWIDFTSGATTQILVGGGVTAAPVWTAATGTGAPVRAGAPTGTGDWTLPTINLTGGQIAFPATQAPSVGANTLDDYEEGTWTPSLGGNTTYNQQTGTYTKIGRLVFISSRLEINAIGTGSTTLISGAPFTNSYSSASIGSCIFNLLTHNVVFLVPYINTGATTMSFSELTAAAASGTEPADIYQNSAETFATITYTAA